MAKKTYKSDELIEALKDERVTDSLIERLTKLLSPTINAILDEKLDKKLDEKLNLFAAAINEKLDTIIDRSTKANDQITDLSQKVKSLEDSNDTLRSQVDALISAQRINTLLFHGVEEELDMPTDVCSDSSKKGPIQTGALQA